MKGRSPKAPKPNRPAPPAVVQIEDASDPRGRARVLCADWALPVSDRLRRHLSELAAIQRYRQARKSKRSGPNGTPLPCAAGRPRR